MEDQDKLQGHSWFTLSGDVNSDMVHRMFDAAADMSEDMVTDAHVLLQSNGGYVSDGICLYNYMSNLPVRFHLYNAGAVASIAVIVFLAGHKRYASSTARFMVHKSHASAPSGARPDALRIIVEGLQADDARTEEILRSHVQFSEEHWRTHAYSDLHLTAAEAVKVNMIDKVTDFRPPPGRRITNI
jgi:ATP-dependent Clp protease protease subunit|eukprot:gene33454-41278_t